MRLERQPAGNADGVPGALLRNFACNKVLHERVVLLTVIIREVPWVNPSERLEIQTLAHGFYRVIVHFLFMDRRRLLQPSSRAGHRARDENRDLTIVREGD